ncbi:hypothetical protein JTB14_024360 [Gonioctena quinquepunctata]|nr:hypothetical protein JTB14_024360 [Gonioctena quinquepunctata]
MVVNRNGRFCDRIWNIDRSALQTLHKVSAKAREQNYFQGGLTHSWVEYYENRIESDRSCLNEWHAMDNLESKRPPSPDSVRTKPTETEETEKVIRSTLKEIMMSVDLDEVTSKAIRTKLEEELDMDLTEYKSFIDEEMLVILGQMDAPTEIFDHVYLGSEWNASNYEELQKNGVGHILNVTREIDNFFPGTFDYLNIRVYDDEKTDLLKHWDDTYKYITKAKDKGSKVLVHCKMGISRSASVVIAYAMKACNWDFDTALTHVKEKRSCIKPNTSFLLQLETYQGILDAMKNKEKLQRSKSETNLKSPGSNGKPEKVLANSEPTPIVQAFSKSRDIGNAMSGHDLRHLGARPKSWSPDNLETRELAKVSKSSPVFMSLEEISQKSSSKESMKSLQNSSENKTSLARHVLMPCDNGESYSVSPNQIVHLPGHDTTSSCNNDKKKLVLNLAIQFEMAERKKEIEFSESSCNVRSEKNDRRVEDTWDPGERMSHCDNSSEVCDLTNDSVSEKQTVWASSTTVKTESAVSISCSNSSVKVPDLLHTHTVALRKDSDLFSNHLDKVFDREEKKQQRMSTISLTSSMYAPEHSNDEKFKRDSPSRQSSWSSYDSAVALGFQNENSQLSRHSSWGSGDTRNVPSRNSSWGSYDMRSRGPVHYINEKEAINTILLESATSGDTGVSSAISDKIDIPGEDHKPSSFSRLSISAPEPSSMELVSHEGSLSRSASNVSSVGKLSKDNSNSVISTAQCSSVKQHRTFLENLHNLQDSRVTKKTEDLLDNSSGLGKVRNLKKEFEAKSSTNMDQIESSEKISKQKVSSLPSSPVSVHVTKEKKEDDRSISEDVNFKNLIGLFENKEGAQIRAMTRDLLSYQS